MRQLGVPTVQLDFVISMRSYARNASVQVSVMLGSTAIVIYALMIAFGFHIFVIAYEEPTLRQLYGEEYESYRRHVRRWLPRLPQR